MRTERDDRDRSRAEASGARRLGAALSVALALALPTRAATVIGLLEPVEPAALSARPRGGATAGDFQRFAERLLGQWECTIREWDGVRAEPVWQASQRRSFQFVLQGRFLEEAAYVLDGSGWIQAGLHLLSFDAEQGRVLQSGFWSDAPGRLFAVDGLLGSQGDRIEGTMTVRPPQGPAEKRRISLGFDDRERHVQRVFRQRPDGTEYLHEELVYVRRSEP